ncbi:MAG: hypothetical protein DI551_11040 [Micavibrio aeruginosavorus]|uniref:Uncharacterized protein n=1 Tax=Micavibrio aeruginosavorus TaxID=349221 RepID=A0A2W5MUU9_9BACT|nr:MAG: hypothetical protein DI551_11040 [Micavibrio aeruginosavorus]
MDVTKDLQIQALQLQTAFENLKGVGPRARAEGDILKFGQTVLKDFPQPERIEMVARCFTDLDLRRSFLHGVSSVVDARPHAHTVKAGEQRKTVADLLDEIVDEPTPLTEKIDALIAEIDHEQLGRKPASFQFG